MKRQKPGTIRNYSPPPKRRTLGMRYAEVLKLREALAQNQSRFAQPRPSQQPSR